MIATNLQKNTMKYKIGIPTLLCMVLLRFAVGISFPQDEPSKPENGRIKKTDDKKATKPSANATITVHVKISAEGMETLPTGSTIELRGDEQSCKNVHRESNIKSDEVIFLDLPMCKVRIAIYVT